MNNQNWWKENS